jgi:hypothetical protein
MNLSGGRMVTPLLSSWPWSMSAGWNRVSAGMFVFPRTCFILKSYSYRLAYHLAVLLFRSFGNF